jgi:polyphosphate kinase 2 (PPK2 family)
MRPSRAKINPHIDHLAVERLRLVDQLRARRAASIARGSKSAIMMQFAQERAEAERQEQEQREAARLRKLLGLKPKRRVTLAKAMKQAGAAGVAATATLNPDGSVTLGLKKPATENTMHKILGIEP